MTSLFTGRKVFLDFKEDIEDIIVDANDTGDDGGGVVVGVLDGVLEDALSMSKFTTSFPLFSPLRRDDGDTPSMPRFRNSPETAEIVAAALGAATLTISKSAVLVTAIALDNMGNDVGVAAFIVIVELRFGEAVGGVGRCGGKVSEEEEGHRGAGTGDEEDDPLFGDGCEGDEGREGKDEGEEG